MLIALIALAALFLALLLLGRIALAAALYRLFTRSDRYEPAAAEAPDAVDEHFTTAPREDRITKEEADRLVEQFNWSRYETFLMADPAPKEMP